jgi:hypothetical protein
MSEYEPTQCVQHEIIEDRTVRRIECEVAYRVEGNEQTWRYAGKLVDVLGRDGAGFVALQAGEHVRSDQGLLLPLDEVDF